MIETLTCEVCDEVFAPYIVRPQFECPECGHQHEIPVEHLEYLKRSRPADPDTVLASNRGVYAKEQGLADWLRWKLSQ